MPCAVHNLQGTLRASTRLAPSPHGSPHLIPHCPDLPPRLLQRLLRSRSGLLQATHRGPLRIHRARLGRDRVNVAAAHEGRCRICPVAATDCPEEKLDPVCGIDGIEYNSECEMRAANCGENKDVVVQHKGPCGVIDTLP